MEKGRRRRRPFSLPKAVRLFEPYLPHPLILPLNGAVGSLFHARQGT